MQCHQSVASLAGPPDDMGSAPIRDVEGEKGKDVESSRVESVESSLPRVESVESVESSRVE